MKKILEDKKVKILLKILKTMVYVLLVGFVIVVCLQRFSNNRISIGKYRMFTVISGSMAPKYNIGDVLFAKEKKSSEIKVGDAISYLGRSGDVAGKVVTHEVVSIETTPEGQYLFHAKGLTNVIEDPIVYEDQLYGVVMYRAFILSFIYKIVSTNVGFFAFIIIPLMFIIGSEIVFTLVEKREKEFNKE